jgi:hypothetical protein
MAVRGVPGHEATAQSEGLEAFRLRESAEVQDDEVRQYSHPLCVSGLTLIPAFQPGSVTSATIAANASDLPICL